MKNEIKKCSKCGEDILSSAKKCKHCQADLRSWFARHKILTTIGGIILFFIIIGMIGGEPDKKEVITAESKEQKDDREDEMEEIKEKVYIKVTADKLCTEYESNEIAADKQFKDKYVEVSGVVEAIDSDFTDNAVVRLKCGGEYSFENVSCSFASNDGAAELKKGTSVILQGVSTGEIIGSPMLKECRIK